MDHKATPTNSTDEWHGLLQTCVGKKTTLWATLVTVSTSIHPNDKKCFTFCQRWYNYQAVSLVTFELRGRAATYLRCGGKYDIDFTANFFTVVKEFWKSVNT